MDFRVNRVTTAWILRVSATATLLGVGLMTSGCRSPYYADRGAALGGVAGAVTGAALGDHDGNAAAGAVVGGAVGALTGAAIGDSIDADRRAWSPPPQRVTVTDVVAMSQRGVSTEVIVNHVHTRGVARTLRTDEIIHLHEMGVAQPVIQAMQDAAAVPYREPRRVIVEERVYAPWGPPHVHHPHYWHRRHPHRRFSWGVSVHH